jgi:hypothetical protein
MRKIFILITMTVTLIAGDRALYAKKYSHERKAALIIANTNYEGQGRLVNPKHDGEDLASELKNLGFDVTAYYDLTKLEMDKAIDKFADKLKNYQIGFFYFSGHGTAVNRNNFLVPIGAQLRDKYSVKYHTVAVNEVVDRMEASGTRLNMIILDACRNEYGVRGAGGLSSISAKGTLISFATAPGDTASDNTRERNGMYTKHLLKQLRVPNINQRELFHNVRRDVYSNSNKNQLPYLSDGTIGDFYFKLEVSESGDISSTNQRDKSNDDEILWNEIQHSNVYADIEFFLSKYPNSKFAPLAEFKLQKLATSANVKSYKETWIDEQTSIMWQVEPAKQKYTFNGANNYCKKLKLDGFDNWRLPNVSELKTIQTKNKVKNEASWTGYSYIKLGLLAGTKMSYQWFWSSSTVKSKNSKGWIVNYSDPEVKKSYKSSHMYVRCIR